MTVNLGQMVAAAWEKQLRETEDPFRHSNLLMFFDGRGTAIPYRQYLDRKLINSFGQVIPRMVTVQRNLAKMKSYRPTWGPPLPIPRP